MRQFFDKLKSKSNKSSTHYQDLYKFWDIEPLPCDALPTGVKEIQVSGARVFELEQFFSPEECQYYIAQAEKKGFDSLASEYPKEYRNNQRYLMKGKLILKFSPLFSLLRVEIVGQKHAPFRLDLQETYISLLGGQTFISECETIWNWIWGCLGSNWNKSCHKILEVQQGVQIFAAHGQLSCDLTGWG